MMCEKEKMVKGLEYNPLDETLVNEREKCKLLCQEYNVVPVNYLDERKKIIKKIIGKAGENFLIEQSLWCDYGYNIEIGENFYSNHNLVILDPAPVKFGDNVFIGPNCGFYTAIHPTNPEERNKGLESAQPILVGNNVWIGGGVQVLAGVKIGNNVTIGAGSVVTSDIPDNSVAFGNPCRVHKKL